MGMVSSFLFRSICFQHDYLWLAVGLALLVEVLGPYIIDSLVEEIRYPKLELPFGSVFRTFNQVIGAN